MYRSLGSIALAFAATAACSGAPSNENAGATAEDVTIGAPFAATGYYQIDSAQPTKGEISLISLAPNKTFWGRRCADDACDATDVLSGTYKYSRTKLRFFDASGAAIGSYWYAIDGGSLFLEQVGTGDAYALDSVSESLCDASGGGWSDDDLGAHGFNCTCPAGQGWGPGGCDGCPNGSCAGAPCDDPSLTRCGTACVDLSRDGLNCGACSSVCTKAQSCVSGACR